MKLMSILNDKSCSTAQANMAGANQHMTNTSKDMTDVIDVSDLKLVVEYTLSMLFVHKLIKDTELSVGFDETKCYIQELRKGRVLGTGIKIGGFYLFDKKYNISVVSNNSKFFSYHVSMEVWHCRLGLLANQVLKLLKESLNLTNVDHDSPCKVCHKAKQTRDSFPLRENKSTIFGQLIHLDVWGPYKVVCKEGFRYFLTIIDDFSKPYDDEEGPSGRYGGVYQPDLDDILGDNRESDGSVGTSDHVPIFQNGFLRQKGCRVKRGVKEKQVLLADKSVEVNKHVNVALGINFDTQTPNVVNAGLELFLTVSEAHGIHSPASANEENMNDVGTTVRPILAGNTPGMSSYANVTSEPSRKALNFCTLFTPTGNGVDVVVPVESVRVISERVANTAYGFFPGKRVAYSLLLTMLGTLGVNMDCKKANSSRSLFWNVESSSTSTTPIVEKIDKIERLIIDGNVTLVNDEAKPLLKVDSLGDHDSKDENSSVDNEMANFLASKKLIGSKWVFRIRYKSDGETDRLVLTPLPENIMLAHKELENDNFLHMHSLIKSHFDIALILLKYLKLAHEIGIQFSKRNNGFNIAALSDSDWAKFTVTWRSVLGYCVFVNGCLVSWKSKNNPIMHEKTKHFDIDVHLVKEKVASDGEGKKEVSMSKLDRVNERACATSFTIYLDLFRIKFLNLDVSIGSDSHRSWCPTSLLTWVAGSVCSSLLYSGRSMGGSGYMSSGSSRSYY
uniref:Ribonuclease H-like domain-containing protein n=1 Tax=Tanacetum cinerariifolium TaxID=118510 RepID=A0A6L2LM25_TANCI|nr:ribonuclease H-like domain-containing protein [Tanacetum cinerariifolium]